MWRVTVFFAVMFCFGAAFGALPDVPLCDNGYLVMSVTSETSISESGEDITTSTVEYSCQSYANNQGTCPESYVSHDVPGLMSTDMNGNCSENIRKVRSKGLFMTADLPVTLCDNGYFDGTACVSYVADSENCPSGYVKSFVNQSVRRVLGECPDGAYMIDDNQITVWAYPYDSTPDTTIVVRLCDSGYDMNYLGDCAALCTVSNTGVKTQYLRTDTGLVFPVYGKKLTTPSLNIKTGNRQCYVNMVPGNGSGAINVRYQDVVYRTVN